MPRAQGGASDAAGSELRAPAANRHHRPCRADRRRHHHSGSREFRIAHAAPPGARDSSFALGNRRPAARPQPRYSLVHRHPRRPGAVRRGFGSRPLASAAAAVLQPLGAHRADVHRDPHGRHFSARPRHRAADLSRPYARDHDRAVARSRPVTQKRTSYPALPVPVPLARFSAADDLRAAIGLWAAWLNGERRASAHTVAAYGRDLAFFLDFLTEHLGELPSLAAISTLRPGDFRAYLARRAQDGIERGSLARGLSVLRGFVRFLQRRGLASTTALAALRSPKLPHSVPKPLTVEDATGSLGAAAEVARNQWHGKRDTAVLALLYGCGLRISEALGLTRGAAPLGEMLAVTGKGSKQRHLPVLRMVREAVADYLAACPYALTNERPVFVGARGGPLRPRHVQRH